MALLGISLALASLGYVFFVKQYRPWTFLSNYFQTPANKKLNDTGGPKPRAFSTVTRIDEERPTSEQFQNEATRTLQNVPSDTVKSRMPTVLGVTTARGTDIASQPAVQRMPPPPPRTSRPSLGPSLNRGNLMPPSMPRGPLPNRGPPSGSRSSGSLLPPSTTPLPTGMALPGKPTRKVILEPGHSPLDWAHLTRSNANLAGVENLQRITKSQLALQNGRKGKPAWSAFHGKVYNITPYLPFHPGGKGELMRAAGKDGGQLFMEIHPWVNWDNMLGPCLVGFLVSEADSTAVSTMDQMD